MYNFAGRSLYISILFGGRTEKNATFVTHDDYLRHQDMETDMSSEATSPDNVGGLVFISLISL